MSIVRKTKAVPEVRHYKRPRRSGNSSLGLRYMSFFFQYTDMGSVRVEEDPRRLLFTLIFSFFWTVGKLPFPQTTRNEHADSPPTHTQPLHRNPRSLWLWCFLFQIFLRPRTRSIYDVCDPTVFNRRTREHVVGVCRACNTRLYTYAHGQAARNRPRSGCAPPFFHHHFR